MECVGRIDNVIAYFEEIDKANIEYEDIYEHHLTKEFIKERKLIRDEDYNIFDHVTVLKVKKKELTEISYYPKDLDAEYFQYKNVIEQETGKEVKHVVFVVTDGEKHLLVYTGGYSYPRFKAFVQKENGKDIRKLLKKEHD